MGKRIVLKIACSIAILQELLLMYLVYNEIGEAKLPMQIIRLIIQLALMGLIFGFNSSKAKTILMIYYVGSGMFGLHFYPDDGFLTMAAISNIILGLAIYFSDWIEEKMIKKPE